MEKNTRYCTKCGKPRTDNNPGNICPECKTAAQNAATPVVDNLKNPTTNGWIRVLYVTVSAICLIIPLATLFMIGLVQDMSDFEITMLSGIFPVFGIVEELPLLAFLISCAVSFIILTVGMLLVTFFQNVQDIRDDLKAVRAGRN